MIARRTIRRAVLLGVAASLLAVWFHHDWSKVPRDVFAKRSESRKLGQRIQDVSLLDPLTETSVSMRRLQGQRATVIVFTGVDCPVSNLYLARLNELVQEYRDRGVAFLAVNSNAGESAARVASHAREYGLRFPMVKDPENAFADGVLSERTCEALVLDADSRLRYRGAIDDQHGRGNSKPGLIRRYLADALDALLAGQPLAITTTPVIGCPIERVELRVSVGQGPRIRPAHPVIAKALLTNESPVVGLPATYAGEVAQILQSKCQPCHRPGLSAPFSLLSYEDVRRHASAIREAVSDLRMPPWHADPRYGQFENDRSLTPGQRETILSWLEQGAPMGDPRAIPPPRAFAEGWTIGKPDVIFEIPAPFVVPASGVIPYQRFRVVTGFREDTWIQAAEARPGDRSVVHHLNIFVHHHDPSTSKLKRNGPLVVSYAPGDMPEVYPAGIASLIPAGADLLFEVHYSPTGKTRVDRSRCGLIFAKSPVRRRAISQGIPQKNLHIPPRDPSYEARSSHTFARDSFLMGMIPHMHLRGKDFQYTAIYPDGRSEILLSVPAFDFAWQSLYRFRDPLPMPRGTRIDCVAHFDNSSANPANPSPDEWVTWGSQSWEEMMTGYIDYYEDVAIGSGSVPIDSFED